MSNKTEAATVKKRVPASHIVAHIILIAGILIVAFPFFWMVVTSFKTDGEAMQIPPTILMLLLSVLMVPGQIFLIPQYTIIMKMHLLDTIPALFIPNLFSAFGTFLMRQFFMTLPKELEEAAIIDVAGRTRIFLQIMLPLSKPGLISLVIFTVRFAWNDFMWPLIVNTSTDKMTLGPALSTLQGQYRVQYPMQMAGAVLAVIPLVIVFFIFQNQFLEGVAHSGIKG